MFKHLLRIIFYDNTLSINMLVIKYYYFTTSIEINIYNYNCGNFEFNSIRFFSILTKKFGF